MPLINVPREQVMKETLEMVAQLPAHQQAFFNRIHDNAPWKGKTALVVEWPRSGCDFGWLFTNPSKPRKVFLPGITKPLTLSLHRGYDPTRVIEP
jgi:hypothetical protein